MKGVLVDSKIWVDMAEGHQGIDIRDFILPWDMEVWVHGDTTYTPTLHEPEAS